MAQQRCPICGAPSTLRPGPGRIGRGTQHLDCDHHHAMTAPFDQWLAAYSRQLQAEVDAWLHPADTVPDHPHDWHPVERHPSLEVLECAGCDTVTVVDIRGAADPASRGD
jgi:hypothetical protein